MIAGLKKFSWSIFVCVLVVSSAFGLEEQSTPGPPIPACQGPDNANLKVRIQGADLVVVGQVRSVQPGPRAPHISEHNANWQDAVVEVKSVVKGTAQPRIVVVRFPASTDIAWFRSPKLKKGERHIFILRRDVVSGKPTATVEGVSQPVDTALDPEDVLSENDLDRVLCLCGSRGIESSRPAPR